MKISSSIHPQPGQAHFAVFDVLADDKPFFAGLMIGNLRADPPTSTEIGNAVLRCLIAAQDQCANTDQVWIVEIVQPNRAAERVGQVAEGINRHAAAAFYCADEDCYQAAWNALHVRAK